MPVRGLSPPPGGAAISLGAAVAPDTLPSLTKVCRSNAFRSQFLSNIAKTEQLSNYNCIRVFILMNHCRLFAGPKSLNIVHLAGSDYGVFYIDIPRCLAESEGRE